MDKIRVYTDFTITPKTDKGLKRYFNSIARNLPVGWKSRIEFDYSDTDTFRIVKDVICIETHSFEDAVTKEILQGTLYVGLTNKEIILLRTETNSSLKNEEQLEIIGYINHEFHKSALKTNKHYSDFHHNFEYRGINDANWNKIDFRDARPIRIFAKKEKTQFIVSRNDYKKIGEKEVQFTSPNNISLCLSIMKKSYKKAQVLFFEITDSHKTKISIKGEDLKKLYDYFEEIQSCIIFSYISVEAMSNAAIPEDYQYENTNERGIKEIWNKSNIERWMSTSDKIANILPQILKTKNPKEEHFWQYFKELESLRNSLVHQKTIEDGSRIDSKFYETLLDKNVFKLAESSIDVIKYFYDYDDAYPYFPLGLGVAKLQILEIESMEKHFKILDDKGESSL